MLKENPILDGSAKVKKEDLVGLWDSGCPFLPKLSRGRIASTTHSFILRKHLSKMAGRVRS